MGNTKAPVPLTADPDILDRTVRLLRPEGRSNREGREVAGIRRLGVLHCHSVIIKTTLEHRDERLCCRVSPTVLHRSQNLMCSVISKPIYPKQCLFILIPYEISNNSFEITWKKIRQVKKISHISVNQHFQHSFGKDMNR